MRRAIAGVVALVALGVPARAAAQLPDVTTSKTSYAMANFGSHRGITVSARCPDGHAARRRRRLAAPRPTRRDPHERARARRHDGAVPSGASPVDRAPADGAVDPGHWMTIANFTGSARPATRPRRSRSARRAAGRRTPSSRSQAGPARTPRRRSPARPRDRDVPGRHAPDRRRRDDEHGRPGQRRRRRSATTATSSRSATTRPTRPASRPRTARRPPTRGRRTARRASTTATDVVTAYALCSSDPATTPVQVARTDVDGPDAQAGTTITTASATCPAGTRMLGGGYRVDETVAGVGGLQPQQGYHMRGSYPPRPAAAAAADGTANPDDLDGARPGGRPGPRGRQAHEPRARSRCARRRRAAPDLGPGLIAAPGSRPSVGQPLTYTLTTANHGADAAGVQLTRRRCRRC